MTSPLYNHSGRLSAGAHESNADMKMAYPESLKDVGEHQQEFRDNNSCERGIDPRVVGVFTNAQSGRNVFHTAWQKEREAEGQFRLVVDLTMKESCTWDRY